MVDIKRRKKLAFYLRQLSNGQLTNDEFEDAIMGDVSHGWLPEQYYRSKEAKDDDAAILALLYCSWGLYSDTEEHRVELTDHAFKEISRYILFLQSDQEYDWESFDESNALTRISWLDLALMILTLGLYLIPVNRRRNKEVERIAKTGEFKFWPFKTQADYTRQLEAPLFLNSTTHPPNSTVR